MRLTIFIHCKWISILNPRCVSSPLVRNHSPHLLVHSMTVLSDRAAPSHPLWERCHASSQNTISHVTFTSCVALIAVCQKVATEVKC